MTASLQIRFGRYRINRVEPGFHNESLASGEDGVLSFQVWARKGRRAVVVNYLYSWWGVSDQQDLSEPT
jgi:hypothetical protein